jgi:hypothetical protein
MLIKDEGHGITEKSLQFWHENKNKIGKIQHLFASFEPLGEAMDELGVLEWNCEIRGTQGSIFLSGCNCGYGGTGPNGTAKILAELGMDLETARGFVQHKRIHYDAILNIWSASPPPDSAFEIPSKEEQAQILEEIRQERGREVWEEMKKARFGDDGEGM